MPVYEYRCNDCGNEFEYMQRMSEPSKSVCETCGGALERLISRSSFHLKGGGWYKDLYSSPKPQDNSTSSTDSKETSSSGDASSSSSGDASGSKGDASSSKSSVPSAAS